MTVKLGAGRRLARTLRMAAAFALAVMTATFVIGDVLKADPPFTIRTDKFSYNEYFSLAWIIRSYNEPIPQLEGTLSPIGRFRDKNGAEYISFLFRAKLCGIIGDMNGRAAAAIRCVGGTYPTMSVAVIAEAQTMSDPIPVRLVLSSTEIAAQNIPLTSYIVASPEILGSRPRDVKANWVKLVQTNAMAPTVQAAVIFCDAGSKCPTLTEEMTFVSVDAVGASSQNVPPPARNMQRGGPVRGPTGITAQQAVVQDDRAATGHPPPGFSHNGAPPTAPLSTVRPGETEIKLTIENVPMEYDDKAVSRVVLSTVRAREANVFGNTADIVNVRTDRVRPTTTSTIRNTTLTVRNQAIDRLTVAGQPVDCQPSAANCSIRASMKPVYLNTTDALGRLPRAVAGTSLRGEKLDPFYDKFGINDVVLPNVMRSGTPPLHSMVYLLEDSTFQIYLSNPKLEGDKAPAFEIKQASKFLRLVRWPDPNKPWKIIASDEPPSGTNQTAVPPAPSAPVPPSTAAQGRQLHLVLKPSAPSAPTNWSPERLAQRLKDSLTTSKVVFRLKTPEGVVVDSNTSIFDLTSSRDAVVVWSGNKSQGQEPLRWEPNQPLQDGVLIVDNQSSIQPALGPPNQRIHSNDSISVQEVKIATALLYDRWQVSVETVTRVYGRDRPDDSNDLCGFSITLSDTRGAWNTVLDRIMQGGKSILRAENIEPITLMRAADLPLRLKVEPNRDRDPGAATCVQETKELGVWTNSERWKVSESRQSKDVGIVETLVPLRLTIKGRWLLGLYGPQNIGAGVDASSGIVADAQEQIFDSLAQFLDKLPGRYFQNSQPVN